jgi:hypothetical protein
VAVSACRALAWYPIDQAAAMPRKSALKVFRTPIGFHDAYVAVPSRKAALAAWGADADLFARGAAELVEDLELVREPLAHPGKVIRRLRGTVEEQVAALPAAPVRPPSPTPAKPRERKKPPKPDRSALIEAELALDAIRQRHANERDDLAGRRAELDRERVCQKDRQAGELAKAEAKLAVVRDRYEQALRKWQG